MHMSSVSARPRAPLWKSTLTIFFVLLVTDGAIRKWLLPNASSMVFVLKDMVLLAAAALLFLMSPGSTRTRIQSLPTAIKLMFALWCALIFVQVFAGQFSLASFVGARYYLISVPLVLLVYRAIGNDGDVVKVERQIAVMVLLTGLLAWVQFYSDYDSPVNRYAWDSFENVALSAGEDPYGAYRVRVTSTFSYISTYTSFLYFATPVICAMVVAARSRRDVLLGSCALAMLASNAMMTGARAAVLFFGLTILLFMPFFASRVRSIVRSPTGLVVAVALLVLAIALAVEPAQAIWARAVYASGEEDSTGRFMSALLSPFHTLQASEPLGIGIGKTFLGFGELLGTSSSHGSFNEVLDDRVGIELGYLIYPFVIWVKLYFLYLGARLAWRTRFVFIKATALAMFAHQMAYLLTIPFYNPVASPLYFASIGMLLSLQAMDRQYAAQRMRSRKHLKPMGALEASPAAS